MAAHKSYCISNCSCEQLYSIVRLLTVVLRLSTNISSFTTDFVVVGYKVCLWKTDRWYNICSCTKKNLYGHNKSAYARHTERFLLPFCSVLTWASACGIHIGTLRVSSYIVVGFANVIVAVLYLLYCRLAKNEKRRGGSSIWCAV